MKYMIALAIFMTTTSASAQDAGPQGGGGPEYGFHLGSLLPSQIEGVTEILPVWGFRYGQPTSFAVLEGTFNNTNAEGVDFTSFHGSVRATFTPMDGFDAFLLGGPSVHYYRPTTSGSRTFKTGLHVGTGFLLRIADTLWFRSDLQFNMMPGVALGIGFGLVLRSSGEAGGGE